MWWNIVRALIAGAIVVGVSELSRRYPRVGALLLTLPIISMLAFVMSWQQHRDLPSIAELARETLILVPLGLVFFVPLAFAVRWGLSFWGAMVAGIALALVTIGVWFAFGPRT